MARKAMDFSASDGRKENASKSRKESGQRYLQRSSHGGIMLLELGFQVSFIQQHVLPNNAERSVMALVTRVCKVAGTLS